MRSVVEGGKTMARRWVDRGLRQLMNVGENIKKKLDKGIWFAKWKRSNSGKKREQAGDNG